MAVVGTSPGCPWPACARPAGPSLPAKVRAPDIACPDLTRLVALRYQCWCHSTGSMWPCTAGLIFLHNCDPYACGHVQGLADLCSGKRCSALTAGFFDQTVSAIARSRLRIIKLMLSVFALLLFSSFPNSLSSLSFADCLSRSHVCLFVSLSAGLAVSLSLSLSLS